MDTTLTGTTVYEEHQSFWLMYVIALAVLIGLAVSAGLSGAHMNQMAPKDQASLLFGVGVMILVIWGFSRFTVSVSTTVLTFGFRIWHRKVPVTSVQVGEVVRIPFWYGIGLHYAGGIWVYNAKLGRGVMITINGRRYLVGSDNPERLQSALLQVSPRRDKA